MQVHPNTIADFDRERVHDALSTPGVEVHVEEGAPEEGYVNFNCWTEGSLLPIWKTIQRLLAEQPAIRNASIVCCTGKHGWDDYLLLQSAYEGESSDVLDEGR